MTPLIDCTFNLLVFFLLTPSLARAEGYLTTNLPLDPGPNDIEVRPIDPVVRIELLDEGPAGEGVEIVLNDSQSLGANFGALGAALRQEREAGLAPSVGVLIAPTMRCRHKWVVRAMDEVVAARFGNVYFAAGLSQVFQRVIRCPTTTYGIKCRSRAT
jgi:biopolymer transport protein ExbD